MSKPKVVVGCMTPGIEESRLFTDCEVTSWTQPGLVPKQTLLDMVKDANPDGIYISTFEQLDLPMLERAPKLRAVASYGVGTNNCDLPAATARGIPVGYTPEVVTEATADHTMALMLSLSRRVVEAANYVKAGKWETWSPTLMISNDLYGKTVGIVGMGNIGRAIVKRCAGFDMRVLYHAHSARPVVDATFGAQHVDLDTLLAQSDIVVTIVPLTDETNGMINAGALKKMKKTALLINTARGPVVDPKALYEALKSGEIQAAALDVTVPEPIAKDDPLLSLDNCLVVPHIATSTWEARRAMTVLSVDNLLAGLSGAPMPRCANPEVYGR